MKKFIFMTMILFLSRESSASLMQLTYDEFYAPPSVGNFPVDRSGVVSFTFDDAVADTDPSPTNGAFVSPLISGFMFLSGIQYSIDSTASSAMSTYSSGMNYLKTTGTIVNQELGYVRSFFLYFGGDLAATAGQSLQNIIEDCYELHLIVFDPSAVVDSPEYKASYGSYENGKVGVGAVAVATVPESSSIMLFLLGAFAIVASRMINIKKL